MHLRLTAWTKVYKEAKLRILAQFEDFLKIELLVDLS